MFQQSNVYQQSNPYAQQNMYQYNTDTYYVIICILSSLIMEIKIITSHLKWSFMNQPQQPYMNQQPQPYMNSQYYMPPPSPYNQQAMFLSDQNNRTRRKINKSNSNNQVNFLVSFPNLKIQMVTMM